VNEVEVVRVGERELLVRFASLELEEAVSRAHALRAALERGQAAKDEKLSLKGKTVLGAGSLLLELELGAGDSMIEGALEQLRRMARESAVEHGPSTSESARTEHEIEVRYGGEDGPDLAVVAAECGLAPERIVELHAGAEYRVAFLGFCPGYPYLVGLPRELEVARLASPRAQVPAGSVAIAGPFAGIYPSATPGGWRLLGRTETRLFDPAADPPALLAPGDRVRFVARGER
jgi:KipI family sensor histidine kinase inhibitor